MARLRRDTAAAHAAAEQAFDWQSRTATLAGYRDLLGALHAFHAGWEPRAAAALDDPALFDERRRAHLLEADLRHLGPPRAPARPPRLPALPDRAAALGSLYVMEGSRLGGRLIARHVGAVLGLRPECGLSYHSAGSGASWRALCVRLDADLAEGRETDAAVAAALDTFACLRDVLAETTAEASGPPRFVHAPMPRPPAA